MQAEAASDGAVITGLKTKLLRAGAFVYVCLAIVRLLISRARYIGYSLWSSDGKTTVTVGSDPILIAWAVGGILIFVVLMRARPRTVIEGQPGRVRRLVSHLIDFVFSLMIFSALSSLVPLLVEAKRLGRFAWSFQRFYATDFDTFLGTPLVFGVMALMVCYGALPLTRGTQTLGGFIMRIKMTSPFGREGCLPFRAALRRIWWEFLWACTSWGARSPFIAPERLLAETPTVLVADE